MTKEDIDREMRAICKEMKSWRDVNKRLDYLIPPEAVRRRELYLMAREELVMVGNAMESGDRVGGRVHEAVYCLLKATLGLRSTNEGGDGSWDTTSF
ncbi:MAG: hypothetical protein QUS33_13275 [Dehalococcoidia bacterium]|nr:hypothetical protein [Dehalococcoidia bacterium]